MKSMKPEPWLLREKGNLRAVREGSGCTRRYSKIECNLAVNPPEADWGFETLPGSVFILGNIYHLVVNQKSFTNEHLAVNSPNGELGGTFE